MESSSNPSVQGKSFTLFIVAALILVLAPGLIDLRKPFAGDQALFVTGARAISHGAVLYRDFWDLKQPGIYWFYWLGLKMPGSAEVAVHSLELLYFLAFAAVIIATLRRYFHQPIYAALAAVLTCGLYLLICSPWHLTQVEGLVGFPLFLSAWLSLKPTNSPGFSWARIFIAGIAAGVVVLFKLMLIVLPIGFFILLLVRERSRRRSLLACILAGVVCTLGLAVVLLPLLISYQSQGDLLLLYNTFIDDPARVTGELPHTSLSVLKGGIAWFAIWTSGLLPLAAIGAFSRRKSLFTWGLIYWLIAGFALIVLQRKGWEYHFLMLLCPIAILAASGVEAIFEMAWNSLRKPAIWVPTLLPILLLTPYLVIGFRKAIRQIHDPRPDFYSTAVTDDAVLSAAGAMPGPIYVLGNPLIYYLSDRPQGAAINGWSPEWLLDDQWRDLSRDLRLKKPVYIFVDQVNQPLLSQTGKEFARVLEERYQIISDRPAGAWYGLKKR